MVVDAEAERKRFHEAHQKERDVLFSNEAFLIGVLQAVSGGSLFAALAQTQSLVTLVGERPFLGFVTMMGLGLVAAVYAAYSKHQYKMWDVKGAVSATHNNQAEADQRSLLASRHLSAMRLAMKAALTFFSLGILGLLAFAWTHELTSGRPSVTQIAPSHPTAARRGSRPEAERESQSK